MVRENYDINVRVTNQKDVDNLARSTDRLNSSLGGLGPIAKAAAGALAAVVSVNTIKGFVNVGREVEELGLRFKFLFGSAEEGAKAFDVLNSFASKVPFSLQEISAASGNLAVVADDATELEEILGIVGNVAAVTGLDFQTTASQIQRSFSGGIAAADIFRERGVRSLLGFKEGAKVTADETAKRFKEVFGEGGEFGDATNDFAQTLTGTLSMLDDKFRRFQQSVAKEFFDELKESFGDLNAQLDENKEVIDATAKAVGQTLAGAVNVAVQSIQFINRNIEIFKALGFAVVVFAAGKAFFGLARGVQAATIALVQFNKATRRNIFLAVVAITLAVLDLVGAFDMLFGKLQQTQGYDATVQKINKINEAIGKVKDSSEEGFYGVGDDSLQAQSKKLRDEANKLLPVLEEQIKKLEEQQRAVEFGSDDWLELNARIVDAQNQYDALTQAIDANIEALHNVPFRTIEIGFDRTTTSLDKFKAALGDFGKGFKTGGLEAINAFDAVKLGSTTATNAINTFRQGVADAFTDAIFEAKNFNEAMKEVARTILKSVVNAIIQMAVQILIIDKFIKPFFENMKDGTEKTKNEQKALNNELQKEIGLRAILALFTGGGGFAIPFLAKGGPAKRNQPYIVGEQGPELFMPNVSGTVVPNDQLSMGTAPGQGDVNINFNISTVVARGFVELLISRRGVITGIINEGLNRQGRRALA